MEMNPDMDSPSLAANLSPGDKHNEFSSLTPTSGQDPTANHGHPPDVVPMDFRLHVSNSDAHNAYRSASQDVDQESNENEPTEETKEIHRSDLNMEDPKDVLLDRPFQSSFNVIENTKMAHGQDVVTSIDDPEQDRHRKAYRLIKAPIDNVPETRLTTEIPTSTPQFQAPTLVSVPDIVDSFRFGAAPTRHPPQYQRQHAEQTRPISISQDPKPVLAEPTTSHSTKKVADASRDTTLQSSNHNGESTLSSHNFNSQYVKNLSTNSDQVSALESAGHNHMQASTASPIAKRTGVRVVPVKPAQARRSKPKKIPFTSVESLTEEVYNQARTTPDPSTRTSRILYEKNSLQPDLSAPDDALPSETVGATELRAALGTVISEQVHSSPATHSGMNDSGSLRHPQTDEGFQIPCKKPAITHHMAATDGQPLIGSTFFDNQVRRENRRPPSRAGSAMSVPNSGGATRDMNAQNFYVPVTRLLELTFLAVKAKEEQEINERIQYTDDITNMTSQVEELEKAKQGIQMELTEKIMLYEQLKMNHANLEKDKTHLNNRCKKHQKQKELLQKEYEEQKKKYEEEVLKQKREIEKANEDSLKKANSVEERRILELNNMQRTIDSQEEVLRKRESELQRKKDTIQQLEKQVEDREKLNAQLNVTLQKLPDSLAAQVERQNEHLKQAMKEEEEFQKQIREHLKAFDSFKDIKSQSEASHVQMLEKINAISEEIAERVAVVDESSILLRDAGTGVVRELQQKLSSIRVDQEARTELQQTITSLSQQQAALDENLRFKNLQIEELNTKLQQFDAIQKQLGSSENEVQRLQKKITENKEFSELKNQLDILRSTISLMSSQAEKLTQDKAAEEKKVADKTERISMLEKEIQQSKLDLLDLQGCHKSDIQQLTEKHNEVLLAKESAHAENQQKHATEFDIMKANLERGVSDARNESTEKEAKMKSDKENYIQELKTMEGRHNDKFARLKMDYDKLKKELNGFKDKLQVTLESPADVAKFIADVVKLRASESEMKLERQEYRMRETEMISDIQKLTTTNAQDKKTLQEQVKEIDRVTTMIASLSSDSQNLGQEVAGFRARQKSFSNQLKFHAAQASQSHQDQENKLIYFQLQNEKVTQFLIDSKILGEGESLTNLVEDIESGATRPSTNGGSVSINSNRRYSQHQPTMVFDEEQDTLPASRIRRKKALQSIPTAPHPVSTSIETGVMRKKDTRTVQFETVTRTASLNAVSPLPEGYQALHNAASQIAEVRKDLRNTSLPGSHMGSNSQMQGGVASRTGSSSAVGQRFSIKTEVQTIETRNVPNSKFGDLIQQSSSTSSPLSDLDTPKLEKRVQHDLAKPGMKDKPKKPLTSAVARRNSRQAETKPTSSVLPKILTTLKSAMKEVQPRARDAEIPDSQTYDITTEALTQPVSTGSARTPAQSLQRVTKTGYAPYPYARKAEGAPTETTKPCITTNDSPPSHLQYQSVPSKSPKLLRTKRARSLSGNLKSPNKRPKL